MKSDSLKTKDLIHVGVYTAIYIVVFFTVGMINAIPFLYPLLFILVPFITGIPFMLFLTKVAEENKSISNAMRMREIRFGTKKFLKNPSMILEYRLVPLMMSVAKIGEELSAAALSRGLGGLKKRTCMVELRFGIWDAGMAILIVALVIWTIIGRI